MKKENMMKLNEQQLDWIRDKLVYEFQEGQTSNRYWFGVDEITLIWVSEEDMWYALKIDKTWDYYCPGRIDRFVNTLSDEQLISWATKDHLGCDADDLEEYINDEILEETA